MKKKVVPKLRLEVKVKVDIITRDNIKIYYTGKFGKELEIMKSNKLLKENH